MSKWGFLSLSHSTGMVLKEDGTKRIVLELEGVAPCKWTAIDSKTGERIAWGMSPTRVDAENDSAVVAEHHRTLRHCD